ncbi:HipA domain-containing protein [Nocardioides sp.]|uniref:HipA domain-containing protein n=1 Tax=Nocardioides sp. TaxID=35761 RepID=UPI0026158AB6|nr:HipA domain-containing protein [Nocardioides sp.]MDI6912473.1 HipA domain-containing protein [Nocardioides sp.]
MDLSGWSVISPEPGGRDQRKAWMAARSDAARSDHWLWKPRTLTDNGTVPALNDVAEVVSSRIAMRIGLPSAECQYALWKGEQGVVSRNVTPSGYDLHDAETYLSAVEGYSRRSPQFDDVGNQRGRLRSDVGYTLDAVVEVLDGLTGPPGWEEMTAYQVFAGFLVLDALVANGDRHPRNWAVLERRSDGCRAIAPTFDHGSSLGSGLSDERRATRDPRAFCRGGFANPFTSRPLLLDLARRAVNDAAASFWFERVADLGSDDFDAAVTAPSGRLSVVASTFIGQVLTINRERLCDVDDSQD